MLLTLDFSILFAVFFVTNSMLWAKGSSAAVPFGTLLVLLTLWLFISTPLTFVGAYFGFKAEVGYSCANDSLDCSLLTKLMW